jgi:hypothetical protein
MKLNETIVSKPRINEAEQKDLPKGVLCRGDWLTCSIEKLNANKRVYGEDVWDKVMDDPEIQEKMTNRTFYGQAEHPSETQSDLQLTSHIVTDMWVEENANEGGHPYKDVYSKVDVLDTPCGRIVNTLIQAGCMVGTSTRAEGDLEEAENDEWGQHQRVVAEAYALRANDFTADPSTYNTLPRNVQMALMDEAVKGAYVLKDRLPKQFVITILENVRVRGAKARIKEIKAAKECADNKCFACANCGKCQKQQEKVEETMTLEELVNNELIKIGMVVNCREGKIEKTGKISKLGESNVTIELEDGTEISTETVVLSGDHVEVVFPDNGGLLGPLEPDMGDGLGDALDGDPLADELGLEGDLDTELDDPLADELGDDPAGLGDELGDEFDSEEEEPGEE